MVGLPPLGNGEFIALPFAIGCGFAGGGLRELCPKEAIWHFSPFVFTGLPRARLADARAPARSTGRWCCCSRRSALELLRQALGARWSEHQRLFYLPSRARSGR